MPSISTDVSLYALDTLSARKLEDALDDESARIGLERNGKVVIFPGRTYLLHPVKSLRANQFLFQHGLSKHLPFLFTPAHLTRAAVAKLAPQRLHVVVPNSAGARALRSRTPQGPTARPCPRLTGLANAAQEALATAGTAGATREAPAPHSSTRVVASPDADQLLARLGTCDHLEGALDRDLQQLRHAPESSPYIEGHLRQARYRGIPMTIATRLTTRHGAALHANEVSVDARAVAIACQYPTHAEMPDFLGLLGTHRTPLLVVLASTQDMHYCDCPPYFLPRGASVHGNVSARLASQTFGDGLAAHRYRLTLTHHLPIDPVDRDSGPRRLPVLHVTGWSDRCGMSVDRLEALARHINTLTDDAVALGASEVPVVHCLGGVSRTGMLLAAMALIRHTALPLETIVRDLRASRSPMMVQTERQLRTLAGLAHILGRPVLAG